MRLLPAVALLVLGLALAVFVRASVPETSRGRRSAGRTEKSEPRRTPHRRAGVPVPADAVRPGPPAPPVGVDDPWLADEGGAGASSNGTIGFSGAASAFPARRAHHRSARRPGGTFAREDVDSALAWLVSRQAPDGRWTSAASVRDGAPPDDVALTGHAVLALLSTGDTHQTGPRKEPTKGALKWLRDVQAEDGSFAPSLRDHLPASLALVEAYGLTWSVIFKDAAQRGVNHLHAAQREDGSWAHAPDAAAGERDATAAATVVLAVAHVAELEVERAALTRAATWLASAEAAHGDATTLLARVLCAAVAVPSGVRDDPATAAACDRLLDELVARGDDDADLAAWADGATAAFQVGGATWTRWSEAFVPVALPWQRDDGDLRGSWDPLRGGEDARVAETALRCLVLGAGHRYPRLSRGAVADPPDDDANR